LRFAQFVQKGHGPGVEKNREFSKQTKGLRKKQKTPPARDAWTGIRTKLGRAEHSTGRESGFAPAVLLPNSNDGFQASEWWNVRLERREAMSLALVAL
jgi:hypothetical protein